MSKKTISIAIAFSIAGLGIASSASATPSVSSWQVRGNGAYANAYAGDDCQWASFDISGNDEIVLSGGPANSSSGVWAGYWSYDWCKATESYGYGYLQGFSGNQSTASASVSFTVYTYGWTQTPDGYWDYVFLGTSTVTADVSWTGVGTAQRGMETWSGRWGQTMSRYRWMGSWREAQVDVAMTIDGRAQSFEYTYGSIGRYSSGATEIYQY